MQEKKNQAKGYALGFTLALALLPVKAEARTSLECIRRTVWAEARGEPPLGQQAVAHVIMNRAREGREGVCSVVSKSGQFKQASPPASFTVYLSGHDPTYGATHFQRRNIKKWLRLRKHTTIGSHTFYGK